MERWEMLNSVLMPVDWALRVPIRLMKIAHAYMPFRDWLYRQVREMLFAQFRRDFDLEVMGEENVPETGGVIVAANHQSWLDPQVLAVSSKRKVHFIAKAMFKGWPILPIVYELNETLYIRRGGDEHGVEEVVEALKAGHLVGIFPEGTIPGEEDIPRAELEPDTGLLRGKTGMVRMAIRAGVPIVPLGISGTGAAFPPEAFPRMEMPPIRRRFPVTLRYGKPIRFDIRPEEITHDNLRELTHSVMAKISELVDHGRDFVPVRSLPLKPVEPLAYTPKPAKGKKVPFGVLVVHGFTSSLECVSGLVPYLKNRKIPYRFPILRGHSAQPQDMVGTTHRDWYADAEAALAELMDITEKVIVIGLSMGGLVALELGMNNPGAVSHVVLVAPALRFVDPLAFFAPVLSRIFPFWPSPSAYHDRDRELRQNRNYRIFATDAFASLYEYAGIVEKRLPEFDRPLLILQSRADQVVEPESARIIYNRIASRQKRILWFEESGHEMLLDMEAEAVKSAIDEYIASVVHV
jgi:carboxylesterase